MSMIESRGPVPPWLASKIRWAEFFTALSACGPVAAAVVLLAAVEALWWFGEMESVFVALFWNAVFLVALYFLGKPLLRALHVLMRPEASDEVAYLRRFGPLAQTVKQIEVELRHSPDAAAATKVAFTDAWLVVSHRSRFAVRRLDDLVWAFVKRTTTKLNWVIPIWRSHTVVFRSAAGPDAEAKTSKQGGARLLEQVARRCPWILVGYDEAQDKAWEADRAAIIATVQKRKL